MLTDGSRRDPRDRIRLESLDGWVVEYVGDYPDCFGTYWSNSEGWVSLGEADRFTRKQMLTLDAPFDGRWVSIQEIHEQRLQSMSDHPAGWKRTTVKPDLKIVGGRGSAR